ncbi:MAG: hypothetical protein KAI61_03750 [Alphaproteobacteria bacterium]|nr:hypothetical protein [Alphaproteobacteria bacterium]
MSVVYIGTVFLVIVLLLSLPLFPFWKVLERLKTHHKDIWNDKGPFDIMSLIATPRCLGSFLNFIDIAKNDEVLKQRDPYLVKWCVMAQEIRSLIPKSFLGQFCYFFVFFCFTGILTSVFLNSFG